MPVKILNFTMQRQLETNWCWAANAASISKFYNFGSAFTQCKVACDTLGRTDCCNTPVIRFCNVPWYLEKALTTTSNFRKMLSNSVNINDVVAEINNKRIIGVRIGWNGGGGHFISIYGYDDTNVNPYLYVDDPWNGPSVVSFATLAGSYQGSGRWTHTYYTTTSGPSMLKYTQLNAELLAKAKELFPFEIVGKTGKKSFKRGAEKDDLILFPHEVYFIDFDSLKTEGEPVIENAGVRLIDRSAEGNNVIYEFSGPEQDADLRQIYHGESFTSFYRKTIDDLDDQNRLLSNDYELRLMRQQQLKVEAFWLHRGDSSADKFFPLVSNDFLEAGKEYDHDEFMTILKAAARNYIIDNDDTLGG